MSGQIINTLVDGVGRLIIDDPATLNALTMEMAEQLRRDLQTLEKQARVIVLSGKGRGFCSGANLAGGSGTGASGPDAAAPLRTHFDPLIATVRDLKVPLITQVRGAAAGYGASLALAGDLIVCSETAFFQQAFGKVGLVPDGGSAFTLVKSIGRVRATRMMLLGERVPAPQALEWGMVSEVVGDDELDVCVGRFARLLANGPTLALGRTRQMAWAATTGDLDDAFALEVANQAEMLSTEDHKAALAAFLEKRRPDFSGR